MFISQAWAQAAGGAGGGGGAAELQQFLPLVLIFVVFYFLLIRPQQTKAKKHKQLVSNLRRGDRVATNGGILGTVSKVINESEVQVEIAEGVRIRLLRSAVSDVLAKTEPVSASGKDGGSGKDKVSSKTRESAAEENETTPANDQSTQPEQPAPAGVVGLISRLLGGK